MGVCGGEVNSCGRGTLCSRSVSLMLACRLIGPEEDCQDGNCGRVASGRDISLGDRGVGGAKWSREADETCLASLGEFIASVKVKFKGDL